MNPVLVWKQSPTIWRPQFGHTERQIKTERHKERQRKTERTHRSRDTNRNQKPKKITKPKRFVKNVDLTSSCKVVSLSLAFWFFNHK